MDEPQTDGQEQEPTTPETPQPDMQTPEGTAVKQMYAVEVMEGITLATILITFGFITAAVAGTV
jgi:hypothetical protein